MASTFDNDLQLEEMATGENAGSWGTKTNTNLELIADAFGYGTATIGDADTSLTMPEGSDTAANKNVLRSLFLKITSSASLTTTRVVTLLPNTVSKVWLIENATSGSQTITIKQGSGATINILNGQTKIIATDGAGAGAAVTDLSQDLAITDLFIDDDLSLQSDGAIINIGADNDLQISHSGSAGTITNATGDLTLDVAGDLILDSDAPNWRFKDNGTSILEIGADSQNPTIYAAVADKDIQFKGNDGGSTITALTLDMSEAGRAIFNAGLLSNHTNDIRKAQITSQYDSSSFLRLHPSATTDSGGYTNMFFGTSTDNNYGVAIGGLRAGSDGTPSFRIRTHNDSITGVDVLTINNSGVSTFRSGAIFNENGDAADFRVESSNDANMFYVDATDNRIGIRTNDPASTLHIDSDNASGATYGIVQNDGTANTNTIAGWVIRDGTTISSGVRRRRDGSGSPVEVGNFDGDETVDLVQDNQRRITFNTSGHIIVNEPGLTSDFRVESDNESHMLFVDGTNDRIGIKVSSPQDDVHLDNTTGVGLMMTRTSGATSGQLGNIRFGNTNVDSNLANIGAIQDGATDAAYLTFETQKTGAATAERLRISSNGQATFKQTRTETDSESDLGAYVHLRNLSANLNTGIALTLGSNDNPGTAIAAQRVGSNNEHIMKFQVRNSSGASATRATIDGDGDLTISDGNLVIGTSGHGINFSATGSGSGTASSHIFDDYEEGDFTPTLLDGADVSRTLSFANGRYTKIGRTVHVYANITRNDASGTAGNLAIGGLPFTSASGESSVNGGMWTDEGGPSTNSGDTVGLAYISSSQTIVRGVQPTAPSQQTSHRYHQYGQVTNGRSIYMAATYESA